MKQQITIKKPSASAQIQMTPKEEDGLKSARELRSDKSFEELQFGAYFAKNYIK